MLPDGSRWVSATYPTRCWDEARERNADLLDVLQAIAWAVGLWDKAVVPEPPTVTRPADLLARVADKARSATVRERIRTTTWEEV